MTAPNHIVGGIAITGISLSFWDINIFSSPFYLSFCIFITLLPDVDHRKSVIGKVFFPLASFLDKNFGHRTITHSLSLFVPLFIIILFLELNIINPYFGRSGIDFSLIFQFAYLSHLILDMLTIQGIPLFYPFLKNPCVIPANPNLRFRSGNLKSEAMALFLFTMVLVMSYDLFQNGFWTTYNRSFGTVKHAYREFRDSENIISVDYSYKFNGQDFKGVGYILEASENKLDIYYNDGFYDKINTIDLKDNRFKNVEVLPSQTSYKYSVTDFNFDFLTIEELNDSLNNKIVSGFLKSSNTFKLNNKIFKKGKIELHKEISPKLKWIENDTLKDKIRSQIKIKKAKLKELKMFNYERQKELRDLKNYLFQCELNLKNANDLYQKNKYEKLIIEQKKKINNFDLNLKSIVLINEEIKSLKRELKRKTINYFSGNLKIFEVPKE